MLRTLAKYLFRIGGWTSVGEIPKIDKAVYIAAPHTTNWDGFWLLVFKVAMNVDVRFLAKHTLFWWPMGSILSALGALPIDRSDAASIVPKLVDSFEKEDKLLLALAPEGTRKWTPYWKTGFYRIAEAADVPIVLTFIDYGKKRMGIGKVLPRGLSIDDLLIELRNFYAPCKGRRPDLQGPIEFPPD